MRETGKGGERKRSGSPATKRHGSFLSRVTMEARKRVLKVGRGTLKQRAEKTRTDYMERVGERLNPSVPRDPLRRESGRRA